MELPGTYRVTIHGPFSPRLRGGKKRSAGAPHGWMTRAVHSKPRVCRKERDCLQDRGLQYPGKGLDAPCTPAGSAPCVVQRPARAYGPRWEPKQFGSRDPLTTAHGHTRRTVTRKQARARAYMIRWRVDKLDRRVCAHLDLAHLFRWDAIISLEFIGLFVAAGVSILKLRFPP